MGAHIAVWSLSGAQKDVWRVHSSLQLRESDDVKALDSKSGVSTSERNWEIIPSKLSHLLCFYQGFLL